VNIKIAQEKQPVKTYNTTLINGYALTIQIKLLKRVGVKGSTELSNFSRNLNRSTEVVFIFLYAVAKINLKN
jgi:hypothetical protein